MSVEDDIRYMADAVDHWPEHPWMPGVTFKDPELLRIVTKYRTPTKETTP